MEEKHGVGGTMHKRFLRYAAAAAVVLALLTAALALERPEAPKAVFSLEAPLEPETHCGPALAPLAQESHAP